MYGGSIDEKTKKINLPNVPTADISNKMANEYKLMFRYRGKALDFTQKSAGINAITTISKQLFGKDIIEVKRKSVKNNRIRMYYFKTDVLEQEKELFNHRNPKFEPVIEDAEDAEYLDGDDLLDDI